MSNVSRQTKNERRDAAREKAREQRLRQQRRERRNRIVLQASIGVVLLAIVAIVVVVIVNSVRPPGPGPRNMANGGITISGAEFTAVRTPAAAGNATPTPQPTTGGRIVIQEWEDFGCPACQSFEQANATQIQELVKSGAAVVQYYPVAILDTHFAAGDNYSTRAANAGAAIANWSPNTYPAFHALLYKTGVQPGEGGAGLSDDRLIQLARQAGASNMPAISKAIKDQQFANWVRQRTDEFANDGGALSGVAFPSSHQGASTPTIVVNGQYYDSSTTTFGAFVTKVGGAYTPTPSPTPTPIPTPTHTKSK